MQPTESHFLNRKRIPWPLLGILLLCIVPFLLAFLLYRFQEEFTFKCVQAGQLVQPPRPLSMLPALASLSQPSGKWQVIYLEPTACETSCGEHLEILKRIHQALGKDQNRVQLARLHLTEPLAGIAAENSTLLVDPRGFLIMVYPSNAFNPKGLLEDMKRLLRFSQVG